MRVTRSQLRSLIQDALITEERLQSLIDPFTRYGLPDGVPDPDETLLRAIKLIWNLGSPLSTEDAKKIYFAFKHDPVKIGMAARVISYVMIQTVVPSVKITKLRGVIAKLYKKIVGKINNAHINQIDRSAKEFFAEQVKNQQVHSNKKDKKEMKWKPISQYKRASSDSQYLKDLRQAAFKDSVQQPISPGVRQPILIDLISGKTFPLNPAHVRGKTPSAILKQYKGRFKNRYRNSLKDEIHFALLDGKKPIAKFKKQSA